MKYKVLIFVSTLILFLGILLMNNNHKENNELIFGTIQIPFSSDPLDFDYYTHHYAFSSIFSKLVSSDKNGEIFPMLASEWKHSENFQVWKFKIRKDLKYSNGDNILIDDIVLNFKRLVFLKNQKDSKSGVLEFIEGFSSFNNMNNDLKGLNIDGDWLVFNFNKAMPNLLDSISFGFYGLAHPSLYNNQTGEWRTGVYPISSSSYSVKKWDKDTYEIALRSDSNFIDLTNRIKKIKFELVQKIHESKDLNNIDILVADKNSLLVNDQFQYAGSMQNFKIGYVKCHSWNKENSPFQRREVRAWFRQKFYESLKLNNFPITHSFFPPNIIGIKPITSNGSIEKPKFNHFNLITHPVMSTAKLKENKNIKSIAEIFSDALLALGDNSGANIIQKDLPEDRMYDVAISGTGMESVDYLETVKFMFLSKEGINLPDESGLILNELSKDKPDINVINQEIWDQAIIWPIRHYSSGYWFNKNSNIDYSEINFESASIDFQFLKYK